MRKKQLYSWLILSLCLLSFTVKAQAQQTHTIFDKAGKPVSFNQLMAKTKGKSHIFFGELHNNAIAHWLQFEITKQLHEKHGENLVIGAEMFEADNQLLIDEYFSDKIKQKSFEEEARLSKNYKTDYKPILEFAKKNKLKFIATNIPRRYANAVFNNGLDILQQLSDQAKSYIAPLPLAIDTNQISYKEIRKMTSGHGGGFMMEAQAVKDATMAHFILLNSDTDIVFLHLNGSYHSDKYEGIITFLKSSVNEDRILTLTTVTQEQIEYLEEESHQLADFIICVDSDMTPTH